METLFGALVIFGLRLLDVPIGTMRTLFMVRGERLKAFPLAFFESLIWLLAISQIIQQVNSWPNIFAYASGFAVGTVVGMTLEKWIASGFVMVRVVSKQAAGRIVGPIRAAGFGVTVVPGQGIDGDQPVLFIVALRKRARELLSLVDQHDANAFVTVDPVQRTIGGFVPQAGGTYGTAAR